VIKILAAAIMALLLGACSNDPYSFRYVDLADASRASPPARPPGPTATIIARREPSMGLWNATYYFLLDGAKVAELNRGEQYRFLAPAGQHVVGSLCLPLIGGLLRNEVGLDAQPGKTYVFRLYTSYSEPCLIAPMVAPG
jgi:hypothetical protein